MSVLITYTFTTLPGAEAAGINNNGDVVGFEIDNTLNGSLVLPYSQRYLYSHGQYILLRPDPAQNTDFIPRDINDNGQITGIEGGILLPRNLLRNVFFVVSLHRPEHNDGRWH